MQLIIDNLSKTYPNGTQALKNVSLTIPTGMFGLLGPNGAGKSTLMRTIATLQEADAGAVMLDDLDVLNNKRGTRQILGYLPQEFGVYPKVSAVHMLDHIAMLKGVRHKKERKDLVDALLNRVNLYEHRKKAVSSYSGGMRQRFGIAQCLIGNPKLIIVDEPTAGLDPGERNRFYNLLSEIGQNVIVILSTHIVQDVKELCTNMAIIHQGEVRYHGAPDDAIQQMAGKVWEKSLPKSQLDEYKQNYEVISTKLVGGQPLIHIYQENNPENEFQATEPSLEDVFFAHVFGLNQPMASLA